MCQEPSVKAVGMKCSSVSDHELPKPPESFLFYYCRFPISSGKLKLLRFCGGFFCCCLGVFVVVFLIRCLKPPNFLLFLALLEVTLPNLLGLRTRGTSGGCGSGKQQVVLAYPCFGTNGKSTLRKG